jgi:hypothetical protein
LFSHLTTATTRTPFFDDSIAPKIFPLVQRIIWHF